MQDERKESLEELIVATGVSSLPLKVPLDQRDRIVGNIDILMDVNLPLSLSFGRARLSLKDVLDIAPGTEINLEKGSERTVEIIVNGSVIGSGEVVSVDGCYAVKIQKLGKVL